MRIEHVALWTDDLDRITRFYTEYFCASVTPRYVNARKGFESQFLSIGEGPRIEIMKTTTLSPVQIDPGVERMGLAHVAIAVESEEIVDRLTRRLRQDGVPRIDMGAFEVLRGDLNGDGEVNGLDVDPFVAVLLNGPPSATADMNADGSVNGLDVDSFVTTVVGGGNAVGVTSFSLTQEDFATEIERPGVPLDGASTSTLERAKTQAEH